MSTNRQSLTFDNSKFVQQQAHILRKYREVLEKQPQVVRPQMLKSKRLLVSQCSSPNSKLDMRSSEL